MLCNRRMPARELRGEQQDKHGRHDQQKKGKAVARKVAELLAENGRNLRREQLQSVGLFGGTGDGTNNRALRGGCLAEFLAAILCGKAHPKEHAEEQSVGCHPGGAEEYVRGVTLCRSGDGSPRKRRWKNREIGEHLADPGQCRTAVSLEQRIKELKRDRE